MFRLIAISIILTVIGGIAYIAYTQPNLLPGPLQSASPQIRESVASGVTGLRALISKGKDAQPAVMGIKTEASKVFQEDDSDKPTHQKAMEFAQYQYCKMVVNNYEEAKNNPLSPTPKLED